MRPWHGRACGAWRSVWGGMVAAALAAAPVTGTASAPVPDPAGRVVPAADLQSDLALLRRAFESLHPGLHRYRSPAEIDAAFAALDREFARDRTLAEAYLGFARLTAYLQCGHTYPNFYNQSPAVTAALLEAPRLPFEFRWLESRMVVTRSFATTPALRPGAEVLSIDGRPAGEILAALLPYSRADGANDAKRISNLEVQGRGRYEAFDVYFPLRFPRPASQPFELVVRRSPGAATEEVSVPGMAAAARPATEGAPRGATNPWQYLEPEPGVGLLRMPTWALYNSSWDWQGYLDGLCSAISRIGALATSCSTCARTRAARTSGAPSSPTSSRRTCPPAGWSDARATAASRRTCGPFSRPGTPASTTGVRRPPSSATTTSGWSARARPPRDR